MEVLSLYRSLLRSAQKLPTSNRVGFVVAKTQTDFRKNKHLTNASEIRELYNVGSFLLDSVNAQALHLGALEKDDNYGLMYDKDISPTERERNKQEEEDFKSKRKGEALEEKKPDIYSYKAPGPVKETKKRPKSKTSPRLEKLREELRNATLPISSLKDNKPKEKPHPIQVIADKKKWDRKLKEEEELFRFE